MKGAMLGLFAAAVLGIAAASAFAAGDGNTVWLCGSNYIVLERCLTIAENLSTIVLEDMTELAAAQCPPGSVLAEGWVGPGSEDETTSVAFTANSCSPPPKAENLSGEALSNVCTLVISVKALALPWKTAVYLEGSATWDTIKPGASGNQPGYLIECVVAGLTMKDTCTTIAGHELNVELENVSPLVLLEFPKALKSEEEKAKCSLGGNESGLVYGGDIDLEALEGGSQIGLELSDE